MISVSITPKDSPAVYFDDCETEKHYACEDHRWSLCCPEEYFLDGEEPMFSEIGLWNPVPDIEMTDNTETILLCRVCGAMVLQRYEEKHREFHDQQ